MPRHLTRDPYLLLMLGLVVVPLGLYGLPQFAAANFGTLWAGHLAEPALLALTVAAFFLSPPPAARHEERQFWQLLLATCALWLAGNLAEYVAPWVGGGMPRGFLRDPLYLLSYVTLILAADLRPHLPDGWTRSALGFHFAVASTFLCVLAVILYFFTLPLLQRSGPDVGAATLNTFEALDVLLTLRFAHLAYRAARTAWAPIYACLTLAAAAAVASDGLNILIAAGSLKLGYGTLADAVWWLPMAAILTARRVRALQPQSEEPPVAVSSDEPLTDATGLLLVYALSFPATHVILGALGLPPSGWASSNFLVLGALVAFVGLAVAQQRRLERRNRDLNSRLRVLVTNEQVLQSQKMEAVGLLAGGLAHDFNNLLTVIVGRGELLATSLSQDTDRNDAREIVDTAQRAAAITKQLLTFSRRQVMRTRPMDLNAAVREGEPILRRLVGERQQVVTELADELGAIEADPSQLFQMILNLVANARDAMPDGGTVTIRTRNVTLAYGEPGVVPPTAGGSFAALTVSDTGTGIDDETQQRMFDPFFTRKVGGTGLGLAVVYGVVAQSGGHLRVVSEQGRGTTFWAMFPHANRPAESDSSGRNGPRLSVVRRRTVLLVEDQEAVRASVHHMLTILGHDVLDAAGGDEALVLCRGTSAPPDLLVTDVVMPGLRGPEVAAAVRELVPGIGVVFMSGFIEREADDEIVRDAHAVFVAKPFTLEELRATLAAALSRRVRTG